MNRFTTFVILALLLAFCSFKSSEQDYILNVQKGKSLKNKNETCWIIPTTLKNNTKDTLNYLSMTCSWEEFYSVDNSKLEVEQKACDKNMPKMLTLAPGQRETVEIKLIIIDSLDIAETKFKIGFNLMKVSKKTIYNLNYIEEEQKKKNVIWSNVISL